ncbi:response regulator transcription factor [Ammoniphilus sp. CFH 90114]|uniref:response regulator n=1 Tax=Ammoniphilus sp. CFH 90114 TaxID=2493665 RepID=UPI00100DD858|nr:response regulator transcription factor [Ammoniphilus sp. CFH 90114]RXT07090.1 response regulator transcription factor [Ammoniphilus sp. CFH 90114]
MKIRVLIADDHHVVRSGLSMLIGSQDDMEVIGTASDGIDAYHKALELKPDVIIMDVNMPGENGLSATTKIKAMAPEIEILILTMHDNKEYLFHMLKAGASGYLLKNAHDSDLMNAIRTVHSGAAYLYPSAAKILIEEFVTKVERGAETDQYDLLTEREKEILPLITLGYSYKEISEKLYVSVKTVESYKMKIMEKLQLKTRPELINYALKKGLLEAEKET